MQNNTTTTAIQPLPCPFCGKRPKIRREPASPPEINAPYWIVGCPLRPDPCPVEAMAIGTTRSVAIKLWNTRA
jgi:hypothetical protein